ncbi:hypothetical protein QWZ13_10260 [Reinekea marina]|uniref:DUF2157 domain-containing protein n=1 Tax=Reinekea marina TaxID=1310421 RepID=A0ABV7WU53_9GAMM|nr:hypothetical protein [Reinekea marina]MDN3649296.1 hypothetical protein [Reinekea marina]
MLAYLYAVFDLPSVTILALIAINCLPKKAQALLGVSQQTKLIAWHYFGLLSLVVIVSYLMGATALYELGYNYVVIVFLLPILVFAIATTNLALTALIIVQVGVWLIFSQSYLNLWDALVGELLLIGYLAILITKLLKLSINTVKTYLKLEKP